MDSELKFLVSVLPHKGKTEDEFSELIDLYSKVEALRKKFLKYRTGENATLIRALIGKYEEISKRLEEVLDISPDLFIKRKKDLESKETEFQTLLSNHQVPQDELKELFPIIYY